MIALLEGKIIGKNNNELTLMTSGGVGYRVLVSQAAFGLAAIGSMIILTTYLSVKEDALDLFGFASSAEKALFRNFLSVSGVGPKTALHLLSLGSVEEITVAIGRGDVDYLTKVSGIGKKTAERIVVDLKSKVAKGMKDNGMAMPAASDAVTDVIDGLVTLGYSVLDARDAVKKLDANGKTSEQLLREALRSVK
ncbi:MAG: Holliday junction DNA helicase RuvA [Candidatus Magasanikbacteria bacterium RIFCSPLOWO2_02_FULL_44_11]|uniref:Holliday junction branch migration complex subunit RuvA n=2 Tax=Candidatus Magasanikiibacteriota TaxID=1752731 RepID=A0A1F6NC12_9BACT|nr:MAG: Holliday junction DNA helicase RuvA [Candidatus Magasanikbacteria bacterium RIFCSPHIGHO2_02_FULL_45_10]OGH81402.1 MAG: Holliday junction DNA helicase RuvA [Candidatus Magasanikbacteria bacterium RIFCSPLOWO2_02_FULL_44_11]